VRAARKGKNAKPRQQVVRYLGKNPGGGAHPVGFVGMYGPQTSENFAHAYGYFRARVAHRLPSVLKNEYWISAPSLIRRRVTVNLSPEASPFTQAAALGDLIQLHIEKADKRYPDRVRNLCEGAYRHEMHAVADYVCSLRFRHLSPAYLAELRAQLQHDPDNEKLQVQLATVQATYKEFLQNSSALVSYLIALALTEPEKATHFAPRATKWLQDTLFADATTRQALTESGMWLMMSPDLIKEARAQNHARRRTSS
jgi:hypothetical protein